MIHDGLEAFGGYGGTGGGGPLRSAEVSVEATNGTSRSDRGSALSGAWHLTKLVYEGAGVRGERHHPVERQRLRRYQPAQHGPQVRKRRDPFCPRSCPFCWARAGGGGRRGRILRLVLRACGLSGSGNDVASGRGRALVARGGGRGAGYR